jgi:hypothetical protein
MAVTSYSPIPANIPDPVTFKEAAALFAETGLPIGKNTLINHARARGCATERVGGTDYVSYSDLLEVHRDWVRSRDA